MRQAEVYLKGDFAGLLTEFDSGSYTFRYTDMWMADALKKPVSLTLPKSKQKYFSETLFPFFYHLLPEGANKHKICNTLKIDENDYFSLLLATANVDSIGAVTVKPLD